jgi:hypothetical protein
VTPSALPIFSGLHVEQSTGEAERSANKETAGLLETEMDAIPFCFLT